MRYLCVVKYKGTNFCGWQRQTISKLCSVQEEIERVLTKILDKTTIIYGSGRTDAGVHALGQTFHFDTEKELDLYRFIHGFNELVNKDIVLIDCKKTSDDFHARYDVISKTYLYKIKVNKFFDPFMSGLVYQLKTELDFCKMKEALRVFEGEHNFQNFTSKEEDKACFVRNIYKTSIKKVDDFIEIEFTGNGFMRYMVRMMVENIIQVGLCKIDSKFIFDN